MKIISIHNEIYKINNEDFKKLNSFQYPFTQERDDFLIYIEKKYKVFLVLHGSYNY